MTEKTAQEWVNELFFDEDSEEQRQHVIDTIQRIQTDSYNAAVRACATGIHAGNWYRHDYSFYTS